MRGGERVSRRPSCPPPHSRQAKAGQQPPSSTVRVGSSPGPHSGGPWGQVVALQTAGEAGAVGVPLPPCPSPAASPCDRASPCGGREGALSVSPPVLPKSPGSPEVVTSFLGGERSSRRRPHLSGPVALRQDAAGPAGRSLGPPPSSAAPTRLAAGRGAHRTASRSSTGCRPGAGSRSRSRPGCTPGAGAGPRTSGGRTARPLSPRRTRTPGSC